MDQLHSEDQALLEEIFLLVLHSEHVSLSEAWQTTHHDRTTLIKLLRKMHNERRQAAGQPKLVSRHDFD